MIKFSGVKIIGLTGMSGAGKTSVSQLFDSFKIPVIDCDLVARKVVEKGRPCLNELVEVFSSKILDEKGELNRRVLGEIIFNDELARKKLSEIIYPYISYDVLTSIRNLDDENEKLVLLDAPTLFESKIDDICHEIVSVIADYNTCAKRIILRDNITEEQAKARLNSQHSQDFFINNSSYIINNNDNNLQKLEEKVRQLVLIFKGNHGKEKK